MWEPPETPKLSEPSKPTKPSEHSKPLNPTRKSAFRGVNVLDMPELARFREDMVFAKSRFWDNEAVFGGL